MKWPSFSKVDNVKRAGRMAPVIEHLSSKHEAVSANPGITKKKKKRKERISKEP
jgi:hypothetical protein